MTTMFIPTPSAPAVPQSYESHLETPEGVHVRLSYNTADKTLADRYADESAAKLGWKVLEQAPVAPNSLVSKIGAAWTAAVAIPLVLGFAAFLLALAFHVADYIRFDDVMTVITMSARYGLWACPIIGFSLTGVAIFTHSSDKKHV